VRRYALVSLVVACTLALVAGVALISGNLPPARAAEQNATSILPSGQAPSSTIVSSDITTNTTWTKANSPYQVTTDVTVQAGVTLTIEPGVEVRFESYTGLRADGTLKAIGTASQPITFTATTTTKGWWDGIAVIGTASQPNVGSEFAYTTIAYGGGYWNADLHLSYATVTMTHSIIRDSGDDGIYGKNGGVAHLSDTSFTGNTNYAVNFSDGSVNPVLSNLTASGNGVNGVALGSGTLQGNHVWEATGIPYVVTDDETVDSGASLTVQPGVEVQFESYAGLRADGTLKVLGTATRPITFTGTTTTKGWWDGIAVIGTMSQPNVGSEFAYTTIAYAGGYWNADLHLSYATIRVSHSVIRDSGDDGIYVSNGAGGVVIEASQIISNTNYGVNNQDPTTLMAANNWWGSASGPTLTNGCNPGGTGSSINGSVAYKPFLTSPNQEPGPVSPIDVRTLTIAPQRWFVPADGVSRGYVTITLRDGNGQPLPGYPVQVDSDLGSVVSGGTTNAQGQTLAYVTSDTAGDAHLTASLAASACESARSGRTAITFTPFDTSADLLPNAAAPYANDGIQISPEPIVRGVPTTIRVQLTNPNDFPISVNGTLGFLQQSIGLAFGPLKQVTNFVIPPTSTKTISAQWTPAVSGHYCARFDYAWQPVVEAGATGVTQWHNGSTQRNLSIYGGPMNSPSGKETLERADKAFGVVSKTPGAKQLFIQKGILSRWWQWVKDTTKKISRELGGDPPRQDYTVIAVPNKPSVPPLQPNPPDISADRAAALNAVTDAMLDVIAYGRAATISLDRYGGAAAADDLQWSSQQAAAYLYYEQKLGQSMLTAADKIDAFLQVLHNEGVTEAIISASEYQAYQDRLRTQGFTTQEVQDAKQIGMTDEEIEAFRQAILATDPNQIAGDVLVYLADEAAAMRETGNYLKNVQSFPAGAAATAAVAAGTNNLARVYGNAYSFPVGNPLTQTATIELRLRQMNMPADWGVSVSPITATLAPGEQFTATVQISPGAPVAQGTKPRVAVEGYANGDLIGGVVLDVMVPEKAFFDGHLYTYLPLIRR